MCFMRTSKRIKPFNFGYKTMRKTKNGYTSDVYYYSWLDGKHGKAKPIKPNEWVDEMPYRYTSLLLEKYPSLNVGWHVFSTIEQAREWNNHNTRDTIVRVECYGYCKPYGMGVAFNQPAGRFQFMKILEEVA